MRTFQTLDQFVVNAETGTLLLTTGEETPVPAQLAMHREGEYVSMSASFGPLEIALRPRYDNLVRTLSQLKPLDGLQTSRQVGTADVYLALGLHSDGTLILRPTIVQDASGHFSFNLELTSEVRQGVFAWLGINTAL